MRGFTMTKEPLAELRRGTEAERGWLGFGDGDQRREGCHGQWVSVLRAGCAARRLAGKASHGEAGSGTVTAQGCREAGRAGRLWQALGS